ncbi:MAG: hypothetical protein M0037_08330 [Betaproteobacteria bacterium]|nr:hypothetical protein [Betaproteobacteria bacterium]
MGTEGGAHEAAEALLIGVYEDEGQAGRAVEAVIQDGFAMDRLSILGRVHAAGDDVLGVYALDPGSRMKAWAKQGAAWGGIWGLLAGAAGLFILPGIGPLLAAGPIVEALAGAVSGAALGSAAMTGAAAATQLATAMHRVGIPHEALQGFHDAIARGRYLVVLRAGAGQMAPWEALLRRHGALEMKVLPYTRVRDLLPGGPH